MTLAPVSWDRLRASGVARAMAVILALLPLSVAPAAGVATCGEAERRFVGSLAGAWEGPTFTRVAAGEHVEGHSVVESMVELGGCGLVTALQTTLGTSVRSGILSCHGQLMVIG